MTRQLRVLVISADVGESHAAMARSVSEDLRVSPQVGWVSWLNDFSVLGPLLGRMLSRGFRFHLGEVKWSYNVAYRLFTRTRPARRFGERALYHLGGAALERRILAADPHVVVSTYPVMNPVLAGLRAAGRVSCPVVGVVGPLSGLRFWVQPGLDLHLAQYPEAVAEIERLAGPGSARAVRPLVGRQFFEPLARDEARRRLELDPAGPLVLVSGGGWGAGDLAGAVDAALGIPGAEVLVATGRNRQSHLRLAERYASQPRVRLLGFTERMHELLCAADAFVTATGGISCIEARLSGCPAVCYGFAVGHVRDNTRQLERRGLARTASTPAELELQLRCALAAGRPSIPPLAQLPAAADVLTELALTRARASSQTSTPALAAPVVPTRPPRQPAHVPSVTEQA